MRPDCSVKTYAETKIHGQTRGLSLVEFHQRNGDSSFSSSVEVDLRNRRTRQLFITRDFDLARTLVGQLTNAFCHLPGL